MELRDLAANGGFPEPPAGEPVRVVRTAHPDCGGETRIRLSGYVPPRVVRRVVCERCEAAYECGAVEEVDEAGLQPAGAEGSVPTVPSAVAPVLAEAAAEGSVPGDAAAVAPPRRRRPGLPSLRLPSLPPAGSPVWRWVGIPLAAAAVIAALILLQGDDEPSPTVTVGAPGATPAVEGGGRGGVSDEASFVTQPGFSLALPPGWERTPTEGGAAFTAASSDGTADATLWIERAPSLSFAEFEARSLEQLSSLTGNAEVIERIPAPTAAGTVVRLRADTPEGTGVSAPYDVTLRAAGPYRYYLATTVQPGASRMASEGADLIHGSFIPEPDGDGQVQTGPTPGSAEGTAPAPEEAPAP